MSVTVKVFGDVVKGSTEGLIKNLTETSMRVVAQAKALAPVDLGQLRNSIMWKLENGRNDGFNDGGGGEPAENKLSVTPPKGSAFVGTNTKYSIYQEYGTRLMPAQPSIGPAVDIVTKSISYKESVAKLMFIEMDKEMKNPPKLIQGLK